VFSAIPQQGLLAAILEIETRQMCAICRASVPLAMAGPLNAGRHPIIADMRNPRSLGGRFIAPYIFIGGQNRIAHIAQMLLQIFVEYHNQYFIRLSTVFHMLC
jgi:hypothetical protein